MTLTKAELVSIVSDKCHFPRQESAQIVEQVFQILKETLEKGEKVKISGLGNFVTREKRPRIGRNPQTGEEMMISGRRVLTFGGTAGKSSFSHRPGSHHMNHRRPGLN